MFKPYYELLLYFCLFLFVIITTLCDLILPFFNRITRQAWFNAPNSLTSHLNPQSRSPRSLTDCSSEIPVWNLIFRDNEVVGRVGLALCEEKVGVFIILWPTVLLDPHNGPLFKEWFSNSVSKLIYDEIEFLGDKYFYLVSFIFPSLDVLLMDLPGYIYILLGCHEWWQ